MGLTWGGRVSFCQTPQAASFPVSRCWGRYEQRAATAVSALGSAEGSGTADGVLPCPAFSAGGVGVRLMSWLHTCISPGPGPCLAGE